MDSYEKLLERALSDLPDMETSGERFVVPEPSILQEGKTTIMDNFNNIVNIFNRDPDHLMKYLTRELGTAAKIEGGRATFQGKFTKEIFKSNINAYMEEYVICSECGRPDTKLVKLDRILVLKCAACGGHRPVKKRRVTSSTPKDEVEEGKEYEVIIGSVGSKGDGIAKLSKYTIFVPNTSKGQTVKIKIKRISGNLAFAEKV